MNQTELINQIKLIYGSNIEEMYSDAELLAFLNLAESEVIKWQYRLVGIPEDTPDTSEYDSVKVMGVIVGLTQHGAEGEGVHVEGSFNRHFQQDTMLTYIHKNVVPFVGIGR